nr:retrotransposon Orf1 [Tanacetum cinerariifolium]
MTYDSSLGIVKFTYGIDEVAYQIPHKIEQFRSLSNMEKEHKQSIYFRNDDDKIRGVAFGFSETIASLLIRGLPPIVFLGDDPGLYCQISEWDDPEKDLADRGDDDDDDESSRDDTDDEASKEEDDDKASKEEDDEEEEEEYLASVDSFVVPTVDPVPSAEDTEAFETDESAPTPPSPRPRRAKISVRLPSPMAMAASMKARITEFAAAPTPLLPSLSLLTPLSSPLP